MRTFNHVTNPHGFMQIEFEDYRIPAFIWKRLAICTESGCWEWQGGNDSDRPWRVMAMRLLDVEWRAIHSVTQTCANNKCANPAHLCVVLKDLTT
jgi:hypothetical protein